ncbi:sororin [Echinops telfairi]|uniref:Sororin n=1 Tax=Echinops telfairi TaxID=9371 RepID=A0AC55DMY4_ECHTE|nr:sororin [Echinops telfairi]
MSQRQTRSGGAAQRSGSQPSSPNRSLRRSQRKSGSDLQNTVPEIWPKTPHAAPARKPIVLKKIVAHTLEIPAVCSPRRSPRVSGRLEAAATSTPGRRSCFGFERLLAEDSLATVSPVVASKPFEVTGISVKPWAPDTTLPGISPPTAKERRKKKKAPEILKSELDEWAATMNAEFEAAEQFDLLVE